MERGPATAAGGRRKPRRASVDLRPAQIALVAAVAGLGLGCGASSERDGPGEFPAVTVQVVTMRPQTIPRTVSAVGSLESPEPTTIAAEVEGSVEFIDIPEGQRVKAGHVLLRIDDDEFRAVAAASRARFRNADDRLRRARELHTGGVASAQVLDDATSAHDAARAALDEAETRLRKTVVRAPFSGMLGLRQASLGQYLEAADPIVQVTQVDPLDIVFSVPQRHAPELALGQRVMASLGRCEARLEASISALDPRIDPGTRTLRAEARVPNPQGAYSPGMAVHVRVLVDEVADALLVPQEAIVRQGTKQIVYVVDGEERVQQQEVVLGEFFLEAAHVRSGLRQGERVVTNGHQKLRPGAAVEARPHVATANPLLELGWFGPTEGCR